jgi:hypothetical protein
MDYNKTEPNVKMKFTILHKLLTDKTTELGQRIQLKFSNNPHKFVQNKSKRN